MKASLLICILLLAVCAFADTCYTPVDSSTAFSISNIAAGAAGNPSASCRLSSAAVAPAAAPAPASKRHMLRDDPTSSPTAAPTSSPTAAPTSSPTDAPTGSPTAAPTGSPTTAPTGTAAAYAITIASDGSTCGRTSATTPTTFGLYTCDVLAPKVPGVVTSCQVETTTYFPYESIFIKFFGNDTNNVYFGFVANGREQAAGPISISLPKFAPNIIHSYSFLWTYNSILFYIDGVLVSGSYGNQPIPTLPTRYSISSVTHTTANVDENSGYSINTNVNLDFVATTAATTTVFSNITYTPLQQFSCGNSTGINPGAGLSPAACDVRVPRSIYTDSAQNGFAISSTDSTNAPTADTTYYYAGANAIGYRLLRGNLNILTKSSFSAQDYYAVEFWLNGGSSGLEQITIAGALDSSASQLTKPYAVSSALNAVGGIVGGYQWVHVILPLDALGISATTSIYGFQIAPSLPADAGKVIYIDNMYLIQALPMCANSTRVIYDDALRGVKDNSYANGAYITNSNDFHFSGQYSLRWDASNYNGLKFTLNTPVGSSVYQQLSFDVKLDEVSQPGQWFIRLTDANDGNLGSPNGLNLINYYSGVFPPSVNGAADGTTWYKATIPLYEFGVGSDLNVGNIYIFCQDKDFVGTLYFDNIQFESNIPPAQNPDTTSAATALSASLSVVFFTLAAVYLSF